MNELEALFVFVLVSVNFDDIHIQCCNKYLWP